MPNKVNYIPKDYRSVTPYLTIKGADKAIEFYKKAFGAQEITRMLDPQSKKILHAELKFGDSMIMVTDEFDRPGAGRSPKALGDTTVGMFLYVPDVDATFKKAVAAGGQPIMPPSDMFWGDRYGKLSDPFGHHWALATHIEDVNPADMKKRAEEFFTQNAGKQ